jgi:hypothetical protein
MTMSKGCTPRFCRSRARSVLKAERMGEREYRHLVVTVVLSRYKEPMSFQVSGVGHAPVPRSYMIDCKENQGLA